MKIKIYSCIGIAILLAVLARVLWNQPERKLVRLGFPPIPDSAVIDRTYSLGGFSQVYMVKALVPISDLEEYSSGLAWPRKYIGTDPGFTKIATLDEYEALARKLGLEVYVVPRENYPETFEWWDTQNIEEGFIFEDEAAGLSRRAYIDMDRGIAFLIYQYS